MSLTGENKSDIALAVAYLGDGEVAIGGDMMYLRHFVNTLYLVYTINSNYFIKKKRDLATGAIIVHISADKIKSILIPLPPLEEQKRIVAKIEEIFKELEPLEEK